VFQHITASICGRIYARLKESINIFVVRVQRRRKESSRSLSHLMVSFLSSQNAAENVCRLDSTRTRWRIRSAATGFVAGPGGPPGRGTDKGEEKRGMKWKGREDEGGKRDGSIPVIFFLLPVIIITPVATEVP